MAIFKPVNCIPYSSTFDISKERPYYFECLIDCSNKQEGLEVNGYALTILDEDNNQVFPASGEPVQHISLISDLQKINALIGTTDYHHLNSGLNGTYLKFPVIVDSAFISKVSSYLTGNNGGASLVKNWINVSSAAGQVLKVGKSYKWIVTLFQGVNESYYATEPQPKKLDSYDMLLTQGEILGSYAERIHAKPSSQILPDYFIQLFKITGTPDNKGAWSSITSVSERGTRALISAYDYTLGLIYPETGANGLSSDIIGDGYENSKANGFAIYKMSNNPDDMEATRKVDYFMGMPYKGRNSSANCYLYWTFLNGPSSQYLTQVIENYTGTVTANSAEISFITTGGGVSDTFVIDTKTRVVFNTMPVFATAEDRKNDTDMVLNSPFNGIYSPGSFTKSESNGKTVLTIAWYRTADANTWGQLGNKLIYDQWTGRNYQGQKYTANDTDTENSTIDGVINSTPFRFINERPVQIYGTADGATQSINQYGRILYNEKPSATTPGRLYVKPFSSLQAGQLWVESGATVSNPRHFYINSVDTDLWCVTYSNGGLYSNTWNSTSNSYNAASDTNIPRKTRYQIKTWFRSSDENFFTVYDEPVIRLEIRGEWKEDSSKRPRVYFPMSPAPSFIETGTDNSNLEDFEEGIFKQYFMNGTTRQYYYIPINQRNIRVVAKYQQNQFVPWKSFQWFLQDDTDTIIASSSINYSGEIEHVFFGLVESVPYTLVLQIEDQTNAIWIKQTKIQLGPANLICELDTEAEGSGIKTQFARNITAVKVQTTSQGRVPQNNNQTVSGVTENSNFYNSFGQEIITEEDEAVSTFGRRQLRSPMARTAGLDDYCLNIKLMPDMSTQEKDYIYYDAVFSSEQSNEPQRDLSFDEHFIINSKHVLGEDNEDAFFSGEIFGFQIYANNIEDGFMDYSYILNSPFIIEHGQRVPNPNRGKIVLIWDNADLYDSVNRPENWNVLNYDYYEHNPQNIMAYYNVDANGNILSVSTSALPCFLCLSQWQPITYERMSQDKTNIAPISVPWILGQTDYNSIRENIGWQPNTITESNFIINMYTDGQMKVEGQGVNSEQKEILIATAVQTQKGQYNIEMSAIAPEGCSLLFVNRGDYNDTLLCSLDITTFQTMNLKESVYDIYLIIGENTEIRDFEVHIYCETQPCGILESQLGLYSDNIYEFYRELHTEAASVMNIVPPIFKGESSLYNLNMDEIRVLYTIVEDANAEYVQDESDMRPVAGGYINNTPVWYDSDPEGEEGPDMDEYNIYVGTVEYNGQEYDQWQHREVSVDWERFEQAGYSKYYLTNRVIFNGKFKQGLLQDYITNHDVIAANMFYDIFVDKNGEVISYTPIEASLFSDRATIKAAGLTINKLGNTYTIDGQVDYPSTSGSNRVNIVLGTQLLAAGDYTISINTSKMSLDDVYILIHTEDFSQSWIMLLGIDNMLSFNLKQTSSITFELLASNKTTFSHTAFSMVLQSDSTQHGVFLTYGHSPVLFTDLQCQVFNIIEHQFGLEQVGEINSNTSGYYRRTNCLATHVSWKWNEEIMGKNGIWRDGDSITNKGNSINKYSMLKQQKCLPVSMAERAQLSQYEISFYVEGVFNTQSYLTPQYDISTFIYTYIRNEEA